MHASIQGRNFRAESRLLVFFFYFMFAASLSLIFTTIGLQSVDEDQQAFASYLACEAFGQNPDNPCAFEVNRLQQQAVTIALFSVFTLGPYLALVSILPVDKVKKTLESLKMRIIAHNSISQRASMQTNETV